MCANANLRLFVGDCVQLIISVKYYILVRHLLNLSAKRRRRLKSVLRRKFAAKSDLVEKSRSYRFPNYIYHSDGVVGDISPFMETDFFTLSSIVLYEPTT